MYMYASIVILYFRVYLTNNRLCAACIQAYSEAYSEAYSQTAASLIISQYSTESQQ